MDNCSICRRKSYLVKLCKCSSRYCIDHKDAHICTFDFVENGRACIKPIVRQIKQDVLCKVR